MKFSFTVIALFLSFSNHAFAFKCNTVMGGCPSDNTQATSAHMHSESKPQAPTSSKENPPKKEGALETKTASPSSVKK